MSGRAIADAVGDFANVVGIGSFFLDLFVIGSDNDVDRQMFERLDNISNSLNGLNNLVEAGIRVDIAGELAEADTALDRLTTYESASTPEARRDAAEAAVNFADQALNGVMAQAEAVMGSGNMGALTYAFGAVQYAMMVRQTVANVVQDGPLGAPDLHQKIKEAAALLYDESTFDGHLIAAMERIIYDEMVDGTNSFYSVGEVLNTNVIYRSGFTDNFSARLVTLSSSEPAPFANYNNEIASQRNLRQEQLFRDDMAELGINELKSIAIQANTFLGLYAPEASRIYEQELTRDDDIAEGTSRADYIRGDDGDDVISGDNEALTGLPGGPDALAGGAGNDILRGNGSADNLTGGSGNDFLIGGTNIGDALENDTARFEGEARDYEIIGGTTYAIVISPDGSRDKLFDIQYLRFSDSVVELDAGSALDGKGELEDFITAETVALLYEAALDRDSDPRGIDTPGLNFWTGYAEELLTDQGLGLREMSETIAGFLMDSPEFTTKFGNVNNMNNTEFLEQVYQNILGRSPDTGSAGEIGGLEFYRDLLDASQITREGALADIAISPENAEQSAYVLMSLFQDSTPERYQNTDILLEWYFVA